MWYIAVIFLGIEEMVVVKTYKHPFIRTFFMSVINDVAGFIEHHFHLLLI
jgi:hypothetical protein